MTKQKLTTSDSHRATQRGYAAGDVLVEPGERVPSGTPVSTEWMERVDGKKDDLLEAVKEGLDPKRKDVDLTQLSKSALEAMAADNGISPGGLSKSDLITAIKAADDPTR